ncbi:MAG: UvrD-helicase domain-containing protein, partial [Clostridia bacterium]|nr:UvrD-helicase domain-containing protein [Clostridia bacterium]
MGWTAEQQRAIDQRGESLLVSAAAGSGKTAVLTNRVVKFAQTGGSLDRLLVVTFTRLAASEMRERIGKLLQTSDFEDKELLRRQKLLLYKAKICTIDSFFCEIVRENFKTLGILPDFRLLDEAEYQFIKSEVLTDLLEERYADFANGFEELLKLFGGEGENEALSKQISDLYRFLQALPFPEDWADGQKAAYEDPELWLSDACAEILPDVKEYIEIYEDIINESPFTEKGMSVVFSEADLLKRMKDHLEKNEWDEMQRLVSAYTFETSPRCNKSDRTMMKYKIFRNELKGYLSRPIFSMSGEILKSDLAQVKGGVFSLIDTTLEYISRVNAEMKRKNAYSFDAIAHMALSLTVKRDENGIAEKTDYAKELSGMFDEILIDEYQDVNDLQECFFSAISRNNCFTVGDVKQS